MSNYYDEPEATSPLNNPRVVTGIVLTIAGIVAIVGCVGLYILIGNPGGAGVQSTVVVNVTSLPSLTPTLTAIPTDTPAPTETEEEGVGGGGEATPDLTQTFAALPAIRSASISELKGLVQLRLTPEGDFQTITENVSVQEGTGVLTSENSAAKVTTTEGSIIRVGSQTQFTLTDLSGAPSNPVTRLTLDFGKVWTIVGNPLGAGSFVVDTPIGSAEVIGSWMGVEHNSTEQIDIITCLEGDCRYSNQRGVQEFETGQQLIVTAGEPLPDPEAMDFAQINDWNSTKVPEVLTLTGTATLTPTPSITRTPTNTRPPTNTRAPSNTPDAAATGNAASTNAAAEKTSAAQQANQNLTATVFYLNITATANANQAGAPFTATAAAATAISGVATQSSVRLTQTAAVNSANQTATENAIPKFSFSSSSFTVSEPSSGTLVVPVTVSLNRPAPSGGASVFISAAPGSATTPQDFSFTNQTLSFSSGQTQKSVNVTINADIINEATESFTLLLSSPTGGTALGSPSSITITITNAALSEFSFEQSSYSFAEPATGTQIRQVKVKLSSAVGGSGASIVVSVSSGTADNPDDYSMTTPQTLNFGPAETEKLVNITVKSDTENEPTETIVLTLSNPSSGTAIGATPNTTFNITDTPVPFVEFNALTFSGEEKDGRIIATLKINPSSPVPITVSYTVSLAGYTASGTDFTTPTSGTFNVVVPANQTTYNFDVINSTAIFDDGNTAESNETFGVTLSNATRSDSGPVGFSISTTGTATMTIVDSDQPILSVSSVAILEGNGNSSQSLAVNMNRPYLTGGPTVTVNYAVTGGTAVIGTCGNTVSSGGINYQVDYQFTPGSLTFNNNDSSENIPITVCGDGQASANDTIVITISSPTNASIGTASGTFTITNDDATPTVSLSSAFATVGEGSDPSNSTPQVFTASMNVAAEQDVTVNYATSNNTANSGTDYDAANGSIIIPVGLLTSGNITVNVRGDFLDEDNETFFFDLTGVSPPGIASINNGHATITITDDGGDGPVDISLSNTPSSVNENAGTVTINVSLSAPSGKIVTVNFAVGAGGDTATAGIDYSASSVGTLTFNPGEQVKSISITVIDDGTTGENSESITITLSGAVNSTITGSASRFLFINDND